MAGLNLYSVNYQDWTDDLSDLIDKSMLSVGKDEEDAIENARLDARSDSRNFTASKVDEVMGMNISIGQVGAEPRKEQAIPGQTGEDSTHRETGTGFSESKPSIQAYVENAYDEGAGGFTIPLPITKDELLPWLAAIESDLDDPKGITVRDVRSSADSLAAALRGKDATLEELNYLAAKINAMDPDSKDIFLAALESVRYAGNAAELINLAGNLDCLELQPAFNERQYGEFLLDQARDDIADGFWTLTASGDPALSKIADYIDELEACVDPATYGRNAAKRENGIFTDTGYLTELGEFKPAYNGPEDIPDEYRLFSTGEGLLMVTDVELLPFLAKLHALAGDYSCDTKDNLETLAALRSSEYLFLLDGKSAYLTEAAHAYRRGAEAFETWMNADDTQDTKAFAIHITEAHGTIRGDVVQIDLENRQHDIFNHSIQAITIEATMKNGETREYSPQEWEGFSMLDKGRAQILKRAFRDGDHTKVHQHLADIRENAEFTKGVSEGELLAMVNTGYMEKSPHGAIRYLRISHVAAKEILARGDADVYRLIPSGAKKLSPVDAAKYGLWFKEHKELTIRREDLPKLDNWARRSADAVLARQSERGEAQQERELKTGQKSKEPER